MKMHAEINLDDVTKNQEEASKKSDGNQITTAYAVYIIAGSFFKQCIPVSPIKTRNLFLHYCELRDKQQTYLEKKVEKAFTRSFSDLLPVLQLMRCEVYFHSENDNIVVSFYTGFENIRAVVGYDGEVIFSREDTGV